MNGNELDANNMNNGPRHYSTSLIAGAVAGTIVDLTLFPLDTLKTRLQSQFGFIQSGGFRGIYKGLTPTIIGAPFSAGLFFGAYDGFKNLFPNVSNNAAPIVHLCAGIFAEVVCCTAKVPIEIVKQRRQASPNQESIIKIMKNAYYNEGVFGFYRGFWTTIMRDVPFSMLQFPIWEYLKKKYNMFTGKRLTPLEVSLCGSISGGIAAALTTPIDVTKTQIMLANSAINQNFSTVFINIYKTRGINGLFAGFFPRIVFIMIGGALFFGVYEKTCRIIEDKQKLFLYTRLFSTSKLASFDENNEFESKKRKKHKKDKYEDKEKPGGLKLILKVGSGSCLPADEIVNNGNHEVSDYLSKSHKKKKKKHKHHKEKKKRIRDDITIHEEMSLGEETLAEAPISKRSIGFENSSRVTTNLNKSQNGEWVLDETNNLNENRQTLQELLMHLLRALERRDPQNLFAWPVTDRIAPNYSRLISKPMDFDTIKRNIQSNQYTSLNAFIADFKLMCENAMTYNQPETIYYKAAKRLLHAGLKLTGPEKLKTLLSALPGMANIPTSQLGFDINQDYQGDTSNDTIITENNERLNDNEQSNQKKILSKFEAIPDNLAPDEILKQAQNAAKIASEKLVTKITKMGFLKQQNNGSTSLSILVPNDGINPETGERPVLLGSLIGKLNHGVGSIPGFREDRRNMVKTVKPLYYGAFGSYAPTYDSTFANLTKDESDLVLRTYGDEASAQYAESILNFTKDSDYAMTMADNLLDLMTGGDHRKTKRMLDERKKQVILDDIKKPNSQLQPSSCQPLVTSQANTGSSNVTTANSQTKSAPIQIDQLKSLSELGIDTKFIDYYQEQSVFQDRLDQVGGLLGRLQNVQNQRLSAPLPQHLSQISLPSPQEIQLADKITESLAENLKRVPPSAVMSVTGVRKAMGIAQISHVDASQNNCHSPSLVNHGSSHQQTQVSLIGEGIQDRVEAVEGTVSGVDLESELREFLESDPTLTSFPLHDENDRTIEEILSES